jgi:tetratricopeptide (TPR) repeat protein
MRRLYLIGMSLGLALLLSPACAAGGGGGGGGGGGDDETARVVNDSDYNAAMAAAKVGDWAQVIRRMNVYVARKPGDADAWNELGHAYRKTGDLDNAFKGYAKALQIDPKHRNAHEYLGEAYLQAGDLVHAEAELATLNSLCLLPCEQYSDLKKQVRRYRSEHPLASR